MSKQVNTILGRYPIPSARHRSGDWKTGFVQALAVFTLAVAVLSFAACSQSPPPVTGDGIASPEQVEVIGDDPSTLGTATEVDQVETLRFPVSHCGVPDTALEPWGSPGPMTSEIHSGLTRFKRYPETGFEYELAYSHTVNADGLTYTFILRPDIKFSDGSGITAADFEWSWNRAVRMARRGGAAALVFAPVAGFDAAEGNADGEMHGVQVIDERTIQVRLTRPVTHFPIMLGHPVASVLKRSNVASWGGGRSSGPVLGSEIWNESNLPVGAGPFRLTEYGLPLDECTLERNPHYWGEPPDIERIEFVNSGFESADGDFQSGRIHVRRRLLESQIDSEDAFIFGHGQSEFLVLNPTHPTLGNLEFRRALMHATPEFITTDAATKIRVLPESLSPAAPVNGRTPFDPDSAAETLNRCECPDWKAHAIRYMTAFMLEGAGDAFQTPATIAFTNWHDHLGVVVVEELTDLTELSAEADSGMSHLFSVSLAPAYPHPAAMLEQLVAEIPAPEHPEVLGLREAALTAASEPDADRQDGMYASLEQAILDSGLVIPLYSAPTEYALAKPWIHDIGPVWPGASVFRHVRIEHEPLR